MEINGAINGAAILNKALAVSNVERALLFCSKCDKRIQVAAGARLLPCFHTLCQLCASKESINGKLTCIKCKHTFNLNEVMDHSLLPYIKAKCENKNCSNCNENLLAQYKCIECNDFLCLECSRAHKRVKITMGHQLEQLEITDESCVITDNKCQIHAEDISWYCVSCDINACRTCLLENHSGHQYRSFEEYLENYQTEMKNILDDNCKKLPYVSQVISLANQRIQEASTNESIIRAELHRSVDQIHEALANRIKHLYNHLECIGEEKRKVFSEIKGSAEKIESISQQLNHFIEASMSCNNRLLLTRLFHMTKCALKRLEQLKTESRNIANVMNATPFSLILPTNDILTRIQNFGDFINTDQQHTMLSPPPPPPPGPHPPKPLNLQQHQRNSIPIAYYDSGYGNDYVQYAAANYPFNRQIGKLPFSGYATQPLYRAPQPHPRNWIVDPQMACRFSNFNPYQQIQFNQAATANVREGIVTPVHQQILRSSTGSNLPMTYSSQQHMPATNFQNFQPPPSLHYGPAVANIKRQESTFAPCSASDCTDKQKSVSNAEHSVESPQVCSTANKKARTSQKQWYDRTIHSVTSAELSAQFNQEQQQQQQQRSVDRIDCRTSGTSQPVCLEKTLPTKINNNEEPAHIETINLQTMINKTFPEQMLSTGLMEENSNTTLYMDSTVRESFKTNFTTPIERKAKKSILRPMKTSYMAMPSKVRKIEIEEETEIQQKS